MLSHVWGGGLGGGRPTSSRRAPAHSVVEAGVGMWHVRHNVRLQPFTARRDGGLCCAAGVGRRQAARDSSWLMVDRDLGCVHGACSSPAHELRQRGRGSLAPRLPGSKHRQPPCIVDSVTTAYGSWRVSHGQTAPSTVSHEPPHVGPVSPPLQLSCTQPKSHS